MVDGIVSGADCFHLVSDVSVSIGEPYGPMG